MSFFHQMSCISSNSINQVLILISLILACTCAVISEEYATSLSINFANVNITYESGNYAAVYPYSEVDEAHFGTTSQLTAQSGYLYNIKTRSCVVTNMISEPWIALMEWTSWNICKRMNPKILSPSGMKNASAIVFYSKDNEDIDFDPSRKQKVDEMVFIFILNKNGESLVAQLDNGTRIFMRISVGRQHSQPFSAINKTSMLFLSISFIVLMIISLAWLVFYYVQRSRYTYAKQRLSRRLMSAAKKAITKMPLRTVRAGDEELESGFDMCAICIERYRHSDVVRILPCKHVFHKSCIDPWLIEHRSCPICKIDILKAYGMQILRSHESALNIETEVASTSFGYSEFIPPDSGRDFDSDGVEIVRFQLAQIEYHPSSSAMSAARRARDLDSEDSDSGPTDDLSTHYSTQQAATVVEEAGKEGGAETGHAPSVHSVKSDDSEINERQSLMYDVCYQSGDDTNKLSS